MQGNDSDSEDDDENVGKEEAAILNDEEHNKIVRLVYGIPGKGQRVFVIQPYVRWGPKKKKNTQIEYLLAESVTLAQTLENWIVVGTRVVTARNPDRKLVFGSGTIETLRGIVNSNLSVTAVFLSLDILTTSQHEELSRIFGVPVFDRYTVVLNIFKEHARTKVAKLQIALAEIPLLRSRLNWLQNGGKDRHSGGANYIGGPGETYLEKRRRLLVERETKLKNVVEKVKRHRQMIRAQRKSREYPTVAVVGYTNAGKTSLIKALTGDEKMEPKDQLFATLDVTAHGGLLPSKLTAVYVDTVGFISDIPTTLISSFTVTLEDALQADVVVHVYDASHPDKVLQRQCVRNTLEELNLPGKLLDNIIEVGNKVDLLKSDDDRCREGDGLLVSSVTREGLGELAMVIEQRLMRATNRVTRVFRVPNGGEAYSWLHKEASVCGVAVDSSDSQFLHVEVVVNEPAYKRFISMYGMLEVNVNVSSDGNN